MLLQHATVLLIGAYLHAVLPLLTWQALGRPREPAVLLWCLGGLAIGPGLWLVAQSEPMYPMWSMVPGQSLLWMGLGMFIGSLRLDLGLAWSWRWWWVSVAVFAGCMAYLQSVQATFALALLVRVVKALGLGMLTLQAWAVAQRESSRNARAIAVGFGLLMLALLGNALATALGWVGLLRGPANGFNLAVSLVLLLSALPTYVGYLGLALERSLRKSMETRQAQWQVQQWREHRQALSLLERQRTLGQLAESLGHAILQPLTATLLNVQLLQRILRAPAADLQTLPRMLSQVVQGLRRSADMVERIRQYLRPSPQQGGALVLQSVLQDAHDLLYQELLFQGTQLKLQVPAAPVQVLAERLPLTQALVQVLRNAMQAVRGQAQRELLLSLRLVGQEVSIDVTDGGPGFSQQAMAQWQTGGAGADAPSGLGLLMCQDILWQFQGHLSIENLPQGGARVRLCLPLLQATDAT